MRTVILVSGAREWTNWRAIKSRLEMHPNETILIHGGARGADTIAHRYGLHRKWDCHRVPYFGDLKKLGGRRRNECMLDALLTYANHGFDPYFEAFPLPQGTGDAAHDLAR